MARAKSKKTVKKAKKPAPKQAAKKPAATRPAVKKAATKQPAAKPPAAKQAAAKQPAAKPPAAKQGAAKAPAAKQPAAKTRASPAAKSTATPAGSRASSAAKSTPMTAKSSARATGAKSAPKSRAAKGVIPPPSFHVPAGPARQRLRDALAWVEDFVVECTRLAGEDGPLPWPHADMPELVGLERWGTQLAKSDREAGVCALVLAAQHGFPRVLAAGGSELAGMGYRGDEGIDGASVEVQLDRCARWVDDPTEANRQAVQDGIDPTRQLHTWDRDLLPPDAKAFRWYAEIGQLASVAIVKGDGDPASTSYYYWPAEVSAGRGLVVAARGLRTAGSDIEAILRDIYAALTA